MSADAERTWRVFDTKGVEHTVRATPGDSWSRA